MKNSKLRLRCFLAGAFAVCVFACLGQGTRPLCADSAVVPQTLHDQPSNQTLRQSPLRATPLTRIAACLPDGASCDKGGDCCTGNCTPQHHKCGR